LRAFADLIVEVLSVGNPLRVQTANIRRRHIQIEEQPVREVSDWGKMRFVFPDILLLFPQEHKIWWFTRGVHLKRPPYALYRCKLWQFLKQS